MTVLHTGSTKKFSANWGNIFSKGAGDAAKPPKKAEAAKPAKASKPKAAKKAKPKK